MGECVFHQPLGASASGCHSEGQAFIGRMAVALLLGIGVCMTVLAEVWWWRGGLLRIQIPIAQAEGFPVPLLSWGAMIVYAVWYGRTFHLSGGQQWARTFRLGLVLHLLVLLATLVGDMAHDDHGLSAWYVCYWRLVWASVLALGVVGIWRFFWQWRRSGAVDPWLFFWPWLGGYTILWVTSWTGDPFFTLWATSGGLGLLALSRLRRAQAWRKSVGALVATEWVFLAGIALVALGLRIFYTLRIMSEPNFINTGSDGPAYDTLAWAMVQGVPEPRWGNIALFAPGYVRFVALLYWLGGRNYFLVCAVQSVFGVLSCLLMYDVAKRLVGTTAARIAVVFGALNFPMIFAAAAIGHQAMDLFWTLLVVWCLVRYLGDPVWWGRWMGVVGLLLGWAAVTREGNIVFGMFLLGWVMLGVRAKFGWRTALIHGAALSLGFLIVLLPFVLGNTAGVKARIAGQWFIYGYSGVDIHYWFNPWSNPAGAWALFLEQPIHVIIQLSRALVANFNVIFLNQGYGAFDPVFLVRWSTYYYGLWWYAYLLAFVGFGLMVWQAVRTPLEHLGWWLVIGLIVSRTLPHLFLEAGYRHRVVLEPYLIMMATYTVTLLINCPRGQLSEAV